MSKAKILIVRRQPGLGDIICCATVFRACTERYGHDYEVHGCFGLRRWRELWEDQNIVHQFVSHELARASQESLDAQYEFVFDLDGPEWRRMTSTDFAPMNRTDVWLGSIDCEPEDRCPHWRPTYRERSLSHSRIRDSFGLSDKQLTIIQPLPSNGMPWKRWPYMPELAAKLATDYRVLVLHDTPIAEYANMPGVVFDCGLDLRQLGSVLSLADLVIAPDSSFVHFAAAVGVKCLSLYGGTGGAITTKNYGPNARYLQAPIDPNWQCAKTAPCGGYSKRNFWCYGDQHPNFLGECMKNLPVDVVYDAAVKYLEEK